MKFIAMLLCICLCTLLPATNSQADELGLYATYCSVIDSETGRVLYDKYGSEQVPMASTTKILTCILILEKGNLDDYAITSKYAASMPKVRIGVKEGEYYQVRDLLHALMLESFNDAAVILAEYLCGSVEAFAEELNDKAKEIGCTSYHFVTPNGLDATDEGGTHSISASDLARIMAYCTIKSPMKETFLQITRCPTYSFTAYVMSDEAYTPTSKTVSCSNHNALLSNPCALSGKTGFTGKAGYCYVGQLTINDASVSYSLLACGWPNNKNYKWKDSAKIIEYIKSTYNKKDVSVPEILSESYPVVLDAAKSIGSTGEHRLNLGGDTILRNYLLSATDEVNYILRIPATLEAPIEENEKIGELELYINETKIESISIYSLESVAKNNFFNCGREIIEIFFTKCIKIPI